MIKPTPTELSRDDRFHKKMWVKILVECVIKKYKISYDRNKTHFGPVAVDQLKQSDYRSAVSVFGKYTPYIMEIWWETLHQIS